jgi:hypothetical protein
MQWRSAASPKAVKRSAFRIQLLNQRREHAFDASGCCAEAAWRHKGYGVPKGHERNRRGWQRFSGLVMQAVQMDMCGT